MAATLCRTVSSRFVGLWPKCSRPQHFSTCAVCRNEDSSGEMSRIPLAGIRVVDLTRVLAGPYCTMILGDLGAEVIKVERPGVGDDTRAWAPPWVQSESSYFLSVNRNKLCPLHTDTFCVGDDTRAWAPPWVQSESSYFLSVNRNKQSIAVNLKKPAGQKLIQQLACSSDVFIENYLPDKLSEMGLGYEDLKAKAPGLIYCSITGYGQTGPYKHRGGYDVIASGVGGLMHITGPQDGEPCRVGVAMTDLSTGLYAYGAIMTALLGRQKTGLGQHIDCNLLSTQVATLTHIASNYLNSGVEAKKWGTGHSTIVPYQAFKTKDDYMIVGGGNNVLFADICKKMDLDWLVEDPRYADNEKRQANRKSLIDTMSNRFAEKTSREWLDVFEGSTFPYGPINNMEQVFSDPQVLHSGLIQTMEHPTLGTIQVPGPAVKYSESELVLQCPPPTLGQHTDQVLTGVLGYTQDDITSLRHQRVIQ